jgi:hypothetical protein
MGGAVGIENTAIPIIGLDMLDGYREKPLHPSYKTLDTTTLDMKDAWF